MQLRHIRPGSPEWQDAQTQEVEQGTERLTPEDLNHLRTLSEEQRLAPQEVKLTPTAA
jgi:hypothetical protein